MSACSSITSLIRTCSTDGVIGGLQKLFVIAFKDLVPPTGVTNGDVYTLSGGGLVSAIGLDTGKLFVEIGLLKSSAGLKEAGTFDRAKGLAYVTQTFTMFLSNLSTANTAFVESVFNQEVALLFKTRTGNWYAIGLNGQLSLSGLEGETGTAEGDAPGYSLTFTNIDIRPVPMVDPTIVTDLTTA